MARSAVWKPAHRPAGKPASRKTGRMQGMVDEQGVGSERVVADHSRSLTSHWIALTLVAASVSAAPWAMSRLGFRGFVATYAFAVAAWPFARRVSLKTSTIIIIALALRLPMMIHPPLLSGDVYRYLADGSALASGHNPYTTPSSDPRVNHREIPTIYPPHAEALFALVHQLPLWRLLLIGCDVAVLMMLPAPARLGYALLPPAVLEGAWSGHLDLVAGMLLLLAWKRRSGSAAALAVGMKVIPLAAVPAIWAQSARRRFVLLFLAILLIPAIPFFLAGPVMPGMSSYATRWIFNSPAYDLVRSLIELLPLARWWTAIKDPLHLEAISNLVYRHLFADFLTRAVLGVLALALLARFWRRPVASIGILLLCAPAIHPWYWLSAAPLALVREKAWIAFALCAPFSYLLYAGAGKSLVFGLCYGLPLAITLARLRLSASESSDAEWPGAAARSGTAPETSRL